MSDKALPDSVHMSGTILPKLQIDPVNFVFTKLTKIMGSCGTSTIKHLLCIFIDSQLSYIKNIVSCQPY